MPNHVNFLASGQYLKQDEYLVSNNCMFHAIMQADGNFVVYRGCSPEKQHGPIWATNTEGHAPAFAAMQTDGNFVIYSGAEPSQNGGPLWAYTSTPQSGSFYAIMQDDGNFCIYKGSGPDDNKGFIWGSMHIDQIDKIDPIQEIIYDTDNATTSNVGVQEVYRQTVTNNTSQVQTNTIKKSVSDSVSSSWSNEAGISLGVKVEQKFGVPLVAQGKVAVSTNIKDTVTVGGSTNTTVTYDVDTPVVVAPGEKVDVILTAMKAKVTVPYSVRGTVWFKSGNHFDATVPMGNYTGGSSTDLQVIFKSDKDKPTAAVPVAEARSKDAAV